MAGCNNCRRDGDICPQCERRAEDRKDRERDEPIDWPQDLDWNWPIGKEY